MTCPLYRTAFSAASFPLMDFRLIFVPFGLYDEPEVLPCENLKSDPKALTTDIRPIPNLKRVCEVASENGANVYAERLNAAAG